MSAITHCQQKPLPSQVAMRILCYAAVLLLIRGGLISDAAGENPSSSQTDIETIVFLRHGEKPQRGLGQSTCQGLNRVLALPPGPDFEIRESRLRFCARPRGKS